MRHDTFYQKVLVGYNDLETINPVVAKQWHPVKMEIKSRLISHKYAWWLCNNGHEWRALIGSRAGKRGLGCEQCALAQQTSKEEEIVREIIMPGNINNSLPLKFKTRNIVYVDGLKDNLVFEYDGKYWHSGKEEHDITKTLVLLEKGYKLVRVRNSLPSLNIINPRYLELHITDLSEKTLKTIKKEYDNWIESFNS